MLNVSKKTIKHTQKNGKKKATRERIAKGYGLNSLLP
jgi:hypothetical protein